MCVLGDLWRVLEDVSEALDEQGARLVVQVFCSQALAMVPPFDV
jgi:hypothetical protein